MSGGVDSSMALVILKEQGWKPIGVSLKYCVWQDRENLLRENVCCSRESFTIAKKVCQKLDVLYHIFDASTKFKKEVIDYFTKELKENRTPNPCVICNRHLKFKMLFQWAKEHNIDYVATGHYARTKKNPKTNKYELLKAQDKEKDQTYSLCLLPQKWLKNIILPLGDYTKEEIYKLAKKNDFKIFLKRKESQDFCFVAGKSLPNFLSKKLGEKIGIIKDKKDNIIGEHRGLHFYTTGQRKGINLPNGPYYVTGKDIKKNILIVSKNKKNLLSKEAILSSYHLISGKKLLKPIKIKAKIRSQHKSAKAILTPKGKLTFNQPQFSITPGQFAVFYDESTCLGAGMIKG